MPKPYVIYDVRGNVLVKVKARKARKKPRREPPEEVFRPMGFQPPSTRETRSESVLHVPVRGMVLDGDDRVDASAVPAP